jgi:trigger factor
VQEQKDSIFDQLIKSNDVEVPKKLLDTEIHYLQSAAKQQAISSGKLKEDDAKEAVFPREDYEEQAKNRVLLALILSAIVKKFEIKVNSVAVRERVQRIAAGYSKPLELVQWFYQDPSRLAEIQTAVLEDQVVEKIFDVMNAEPVVISYRAAVEKLQDVRKKQSEDLEKRS